MSLTIDEVLHSLRDGVSLTSAKINHGFWETCLKVERLRAGNPDLTDAEIDKAVRRPWFVEGGFLEELTTTLATWPWASEDVYLDCGASSFPEADRLGPLPKTSRAEIEALIHRMMPADWRGGDGLLWKVAALDGRLIEVFKTVSSKRVILVGPAHLRPHAVAWGWKNFQMVEIPLRTARRTRRRICRQIRDALESDMPAVVLFQCGSLSPWFIGRLFNASPQLWLFDLGRALDVIDPDIILRQPWGAAHASALAANYADCSPAWRRWSARKKRIAPAYSCQESSDSAKPVAFVEKKQVDFTLLEQQLTVAREQGHWANRGPATEALEALIREDLELPEGRSVVATSSGTTALWTAAGLECLRHGRLLRWVICSFGFFSSRIGPLAPATALDCDERGMLSLSAIEQLADDAYDGIIVTDVFGRGALDEYRDFAKRRGKALIVDAAAAYDRRFYAESDLSAAISFHHTKPWGFGEGGCVLIDKNEVEAARALANFGIGLPGWIAPYAGNYKLADVPAGLIAQRLMARDFWSLRYRLQYRRLNQICEGVGLVALPAASPVFPGERVATPAFLAVLLPRPVAQSELDAADLSFVARKYYRPLAETVYAEGLYKRIACVSVHPEMASLDNATLCRSFERLRDMNMEN